MSQNYKMKKIALLIVCMIVTMMSKSQDYSFSKNGEEYEFSEVVNSSFSKSTLFSNAKAWVMDAFNNYKAVVQMESETDGKIVVKGNYEFLPKLTYDNYKKFTYERTYFTITIDCKDNKYRYRINDIIIKSINYYSGSLYSDDREFESEITHESHLYEKESAIKRKASIEQDISNAQQTLKGKKLEKAIEGYKKNLAEAEAKIEYENDIYYAEYEFFDSICKSIKKRMMINDDF